MHRFLARGRLEELAVGLDHLLAEILERDLGLPAELGRGLGRVADEQVDLGRAKILGVDLDKLAVELNPAVKFWDPLNLAEAEFWEESNAATIVSPTHRARRPAHPQSGRAR